MINQFSATSSENSPKKLLFVEYNNNDAHHVEFASRIRTDNFFPETMSEQEFIIQARQGGLKNTSGVIIGQLASKPVQLCQLIAKLSVDTPVLIIRPKADIAAITHRLSMYPKTGTYVQVFLHNKPGLWQEYLIKSTQNKSQLSRYQNQLTRAQNQTKHFQYNHIENASFFNSMLESLPLGIIFLDGDTRVKSINPFARSILELDYSRNFKKPLQQLFPANLRPIVKDIVKRGLANFSDSETTSFQLESQNKTKHYLMTCTPVNPGNKMLMVFFQDITDYRESQIALKQSQKDFAQIANTIQDVFWICSSDFKTLYFLSPSFKRVWERDEGYFVRHPTRLTTTIYRPDRNKVIEYIKKPIPNEDQGVDFRVSRPDGTLRWLLARKFKPDNTATSASKTAGIIQDITERKLSELKIKRLSTRDELTGLLNRSAFIESAEKEIISQQEGGDLLAVLYLDLDEFKTINSSLGHRIGDQLLISLARRLSSLLRRQDIIARFAGDEFVILTKIQSLHEIPTIAAKILRCCSKQVLLDDYQVRTSCSIGIALSEHEKTGALRLIQQADTAMYKAKLSGRNNYTFYNDDMNLAAINRLMMESRLRKAVDQRRFTMHYQPIIDCNSKKLVAMEALLRFSDQELSSMGMENIIKLAEENGSIVELGQYCFESICYQMKVWQEAGLLQKIGSIAVNISSKQLAQKTLHSLLFNCLNAYKLSPRQVEIELTESSIMVDKNEGSSSLYNLNNDGFNISIDDFGTGFSSFSRLKHLPVQKLKIDKTFVSDITHDHSDLAICKGIIKMAHELGLVVVAEGVENEGQFELLKSIQCDQIQGYWISKPLAAEQLGDFILEAGL